MPAAGEEPAGLIPISFTPTQLRLLAFAAEVALFILLLSLASWLMCFSSIKELHSNKLLYFTGILVIISLYVWPKLHIFVFGPQLKPSQKLEHENSFRMTLTLITGGIITLVTLYYGYFQMSITQEEATAQAIQQAVEKLGSERIEERLNAVYVLEGIALQSKDISEQPGVEAWRVRNLLYAFIRENAPWDEPNKLPRNPAEYWPLEPYLDWRMNMRFQDSVDSVADEIQPRPDIQAALNVLARIEPYAEAYRPGADVRDNLDLTKCDLRGLRIPEKVAASDLSGCNLSEAKLYTDERLNLSGTKCVDLDAAHASIAYCGLDNAHIEGNNNLFVIDAEGLSCSNTIVEHTNSQWCKLAESHLENVSFRGSNLYSSDFSNASLRNVFFERAGLSEVSFAEAGISGCCFRWADLSAADFKQAKFWQLSNPGIYEMSDKFNYIYRPVDFTGADLRDADFSGVDLSGCVGLSLLQIDAAICDEATLLPEHLRGKEVLVPSFLRIIRPVAAMDRGDVEMFYAIVKDQHGDLMDGVEVEWSVLPEFGDFREDYPSYLCTIMALGEPGVYNSCIRASSGVLSTYASMDISARAGSEEDATTVHEVSAHPPVDIEYLARIEIVNADAQALSSMTIAAGDERRFGYRAYTNSGAEITVDSGLIVRWDTGPLDDVENKKRMVNQAELVPCGRISPNGVFVAGPDAGHSQMGIRLLAYWHGLYDLDTVSLTINPAQN